MNPIALFSGTADIYYAALIIGVGVAAAIITALMLSSYARLRVSGLLCAAAGSFVLAPLLSRFVYWYCSYEQYDGLLDALASPAQGGYSLLGAMAGVLLSCLITRALRLTDSLPALLDCIAPAAALGIGIGRLAGFFSAADKGKMLYTEEGQMGLPISVAVLDESSRAVEWRFASFFIESMAGFAIFIITALLFVVMYRRGRRARNRGDVFFQFLSLFGATQAVLESTRYDALFLRTNGFISLMQIASVIMIVVPIVRRSVCSIKNGGMKLRYLIIWISVLVILGIVGYLEYYVQRHADAYVVCYSLMISLLLLINPLTIGIRAMTERSKQAPDCQRQ